ncbi:MAG: hypothetical protein KGL58_00340 [Pseudomonadota bacterium]|nr:hypothetical protein [Pseudomonadota bacterium]
MVIHKGFLQGAIEPFTVSVHFGSFRVGVPMSEALFQMVPGKRSLEFAAIICQGFGMFEQGIGFPDRLIEGGGMEPAATGRRIGEATLLTGSMAVNI